MTSPSWKSRPYPAARREEHYDSYASKARGERVSVHDPYRWLEVPPSESEETKAFVAEQESFTRDFLASDKNRDKLAKALEKNYNFARFSCPGLRSDGYYYWSHNSGLDPQAQIYRLHESKLPAVWPSDGTSVEGVELFLDPNRFSKDGTAALSATAFSESGKLYAYGISRSGSDWFTVYIRQTESTHAAATDTTSDSGRLDDVVRFVKYSGITWSHDDKGFWYQSLPPKVNQGSETDDIAGTETGGDRDAELMYHRIGTSQDEDILVHKDPENPHNMFGTEVTDDGKYLIMSTSKDTSPTAKTYIVPLEKLDLSGKQRDISQSIPWQKIKDDFEGSIDYIANNDSKFWWQTNRDAPKSKIVTFDLDKPQEGFTDLVKEMPDAILTSSFVVANDKLITIRSRDVKDEMTVLDMHTGQEKGRIASNLIGDFAELRGKRKHNEMFFKLSGFNNPGLIYRLSFADADAGKGEQLFRSTIVEGLKQDDFNAEQVFYNSKDGTRIPMFVVKPKGVTGNAPVLLYGYGGFSIPMTAFFSSEMLTFCKAYGAILAVANIRGGSEYGEEWHEAGTKERKQNVFDDFQCAAHYLYDQNIAEKGKIAIYGGSNGGLLTAACANQRPELYGCVLAAVGVLDMLRFHTFTIGRAWTADYGCADNAEDFDYLYKYSPLHNVNATVEYPPVMLLTGDHDDRVVPLHSFKHIATLQHARPDNKQPLLMRVAIKAGHGAGKSTQQRIEEATDRFSFVALTMGLSFREES